MRILNNQQAIWSSQNADLDDKKTHLNTLVDIDRKLHDMYLISSF